jgi:transglutaminase-like putative cysteine protease
MGFSGKIINALAALALVGSLVSCSPRPTNYDAPHPTERPAITATYTPSPSPTPTMTATPTPTETPTPIPYYLRLLNRFPSDIKNQILEDILRNGTVSQKEVSLIKKLISYDENAIRSIVQSHLIDDEFKSRNPDVAFEYLKGPYPVVFYLDNYFRYKITLPITYKPASKSIEEGFGSCVHYAQICAEILRYHGIEAWNMGVDITSDKGHNVCAFKMENKVYIITNGTGVGDQQGAVLLGPYPDFFTAGRDIENRGYAPPMGDIRLLDPAMITKERRDILDFPWIKAQPGF